MKKNFGRDIAIIGMAFRLPGGVSTKDELWSLLSEGKCAISEIPYSRWPTDLYKDQNKQIPGRSVTFNAGVLDHIRDFDAAFFGISPREAEWLDPQQRLLLEVTHECLEDAYIKPSLLRGSDCGVYTGISSLDYGLQAPKDLPSISPYTMTGNTLSMASNRISYVFDLHGPSISMDTACSSSLVAFHHACQAIKTGEVPFALVAGAHLLQDPYSFVGFSNASMLSPTGTCRPFDERANGYVRSEGVVVLLLRPLDEALAEHNRIYAVVKATGVNTDGSRKKGLTIPSETAQTQLMSRVLSDSGLVGSDIDFIEAHGTGTSVGDPIEARSISSVYCKNRLKEDPLIISSVKANLGHMEPVSGLAGLVKTILCLNHGIVPPVPFEMQPSKNINFEQLKIQCVQNGKQLGSKKTYSASVNSFGFGGVNAHVILQSYHDVHESVNRKQKQSDNKYSIIGGTPLFLSAKSLSSLKKLCGSYADYLSNSPTIDLLNLCSSASCKRDFYKHRVAFLPSECDELTVSLKNFAEGSNNSNCIYECVQQENQKIAFIFNGNGSQYSGMGTELYRTNHLFAEFFDELSDKIEDYIGVSLKSYMQRGQIENEIINNTKISQPLIFAIQIALCQVMSLSGIKPKAVVGHSMGEIAAAFVSGRLSLDEAVKVICVRSMLQHRTKGLGRMAAVSVKASDFVSVLNVLGISDVEIAAFNSADNITISGNTNSLKQLERYCLERHIFFKLLDVDYPFHSFIMDTIKNDLLKQLETVVGMDGNSYTDYYSSVTGLKLSSVERLKSEYWWKNIRQSVYFHQAVKSMVNDGCDYFIEIGSSAILQRYVRESAKGLNKKISIQPSLLKNANGNDRLVELILNIHLCCTGTDLQALYSNSDRYLDLPHYQWDNQCYQYANSSEKNNERYRISSLLGWKVNSANSLWENILEPSKNQLLGDHIVDGECVYAAADIIESVFEAEQELVDCRYLSIEHANILTSVTFATDKYKSVRLEISDNSRNFAIYSRDYLSFEDWICNVRGRLLPASDNGIFDGTEKELIAALNLDSNCSQIIYHDEIYKYTESLGLSYGKSFRQIEQLSLDRSKGILKIDLLQLDDTDKYVIHPGVLDSAFHGLLALLSQEADLKVKDVYLPVKFGRISVEKHAKPISIVGKIRCISQRSVLVDFVLYNSEGKAVGILKNCRFNKVPAKHQSAIAYDMVSSWSYEQTVTSLGNDSVFGGNFPYTLSEIYDLIKQFDYKENLATRSSVYSEILPLLEQLVLAYSYDAFSNICSHNNISKSSFCDSQTLHPLIKYLYDLLCEHSLLRCDDLGFIRTSEISLEEIGSGDEILDYLYSRYPCLVYELIIAREMKDKIPVLLGQCCNGESTANISENTEDSEFVEGSFVSSKSLLSCEICRSINSLIEILVEKVPVSGKLRVLEIGPESIIEEKFVDRISLNWFHNYKDLTDASIINKNNTNESDTFFDLVITNAQLSCSSDAEIFVSDIKRLMSKNAIFVVAERSNDWFGAFSCGYSSKWWSNSESYGVSPLKNHNYWNSLLSRCIGNSYVVKEDAAGNYQGGWYMLISQKADDPIACPDLSAGKNIAFVIPSLTDSSFFEFRSVAERVISQFSERCVKAEVVSSDRNNFIEFDVVVFMSFVGLSEKDGIKEESTFLTEACSISQHLNGKPLVVVTINNSFVPEQKALSGLARVIANEVPSSKVKSIDYYLPSSMATTIDTDFFVSSLLNEIELWDQNDEICYKQGIRYSSEIRVDNSCLSTSFESDHSLITKAQSDVFETTYLDFSTPGRLRNLCWKVKTITVPESDEVLVDVKVTGLNFRDIMLTMGLVPDDALENGFSGPYLGLEFSGVILAVGCGVKDFKVGDKVMGYGSACFSRKLTVKEYAIAKIPDNWSFESAATVPIVFFTAWYAISNLASMERGESILIHGAAGGVGIAAIQIASYLGLEVYATAGSEKKRNFLKMLGVKHIYNSRSLDFFSRLKNDTDGKGVDAVLNCLSGEAMRESLDLLKPFGRFMELGKRDFVENTEIGIKAFKENISYFAIDVDQLFKFRKNKAQKIFSDVTELLASDHFKPLPYVVFESNEVIKAFMYMQQGQQIGKVIIRHNTESECLDKEKNPKDNNSTKLFSNGDSWLITGGTGGFGWKTAKYLLEHGVGQVILVSRSGVKDTDVLEEIYELTDGMKNSDRIIVQKCDASDEVAVQNLWNELRDKGVTVTGIINAATVFDDCLLSEINSARMDKVWKSKYLSAKNFDKIAGNSLKYFVVYSSISVSVGNIGQANYVAANSALEGLVSNRINRGLPACGIEWGPISDAGYLERNSNVKKSLESALGSESMSSYDALEMLPIALVRGGINIFANINWKGICDVNGRVPSRLQQLVSLDSSRTDLISVKDFIRVLEGKSKEEAISLIAELLVNEISETMGMTADQIGKEQNLQSIGLDSLMAMDLIVSIEKRTQVKLSVMAFQDSPTVLKLAEKIYQKISGADYDSSSENREHTSTSDINNEIVKNVLATHVDASDINSFVSSNSKENE